jgi:hypothetical protein
MDQNIIEIKPRVFLQKARSSGFSKNLRIIFLCKKVMNWVHAAVDQVHERSAPVRASSLNGVRRLEDLSHGLD